MMRASSHAAAYMAAVFFAASATALAAQDRPALTLGDAMSEALAKNERLLNQHDVGEQADLGMRLARDAYRLKVVPNVQGSFGETDINSQTYRVDVSQRFTTGTELRASIGTATAQIPAVPGSIGDDIHFYNADSTFTLTQPLLRGFGSRVARRPLDAAEMRRADAGRQQIVSEQQVAVDVAAAFYRVLAQQSLVRVAQQSLDRSRRLRDASEAKLGAGLVSQLDVLRAQQLVAQAELQLFDAQSAMQDARDNLLLLMGHEPGEAIEIAADAPAAASPTDVDAAVATALTRRVDLQRATALIDDADRQLAYARNQLLPQVDVNLAYTRRETSDTFARSFGLDRFRFATFFTISSPVDRTAQLVDFQNATIDRNRRERDAQTLRRRVVDEVRRAVRERDRLLRLIVAADTSVAIGRREVEVAQLRYERGLSDNLDVVTAETNLLTAESRREAAVADSAVSEIGLRAVLGVLDPRKDFRK